MGDCSSVKPMKLNEERESTYLTLVDMFVDVVEPEIILMVLQNRNWDMNAALEDIIILSQTPPNERPKHLSSTNENVISYSSEGENSSKRKLHVRSNHNVPVNMLGNMKPGPFTKPSYSIATDLGSVNDSRKNKDNHNVFNKQAYSKPPIEEMKENQFGKQFNSKPSSEEVKEKQFGIALFLDEYNKIKTLPYAYDRCLLLVRSGIKLMVILRGPPGSGKSHLAKKLLNEAGIDQPKHKKHIFSSDDYFMQNNMYVFNPDKLSDAHEWNRCNVKIAVKDQISPILVDNTNTQAWEMQVYAQLAVLGGYDIEILEPLNWWSFKDNELAKRNVHGVPKHKIRIMIERYEKQITPSKLLQQFDLRYSLSNAPPQPVRSTRRKEKLSSYRNNKPKKKKNELNPKSEVYHSFNWPDADNKFSTLPLEPSEPMPNPQFSFTTQSQHFCFPNMSFLSESKTNLIHENVSNQSCILPEKLDYSNDSISSKRTQTLETSTEICDQIMNSSSHFCDSVKHSVNDLTSVSDGSSGKHFTTRSDHSNSMAYLKNRTLEETNKSTQMSINSTFDFMAESNKLLEALGRPLFTNKEIQKSRSLNSKESSCIFNPLNHKNDSMPLKLVKSKTHEHDQGFGLNCQSTPEVSETNHSENNNSVEEKTLIAQMMIDSIIDKIVDSGNKTNEGNTSKNNQAEKDCVGLTDANEKNDLWDYVLVNDDNSFVYKNSKFTPIPSITTEKSSPSKQDCDTVDTFLINKEPEKSISTDKLVKEESKEKSSVNGEQGNICNTASACFIEPNETNTGNINVTESEYEKLLSSLKNTKWFEGNVKECDTRGNIEYNENSIRNDSHMIPAAGSIGDQLFWSPLSLNEVKYEEKQTNGVKEMVGSGQSSSSLTIIPETCVETKMSSKTNINFTINCDSEKEDRNRTQEMTTSFLKPSRNLNRSNPLMVMNKESSLKGVGSPDLSNWNTVPNPSDDWSPKESHYLVMSSKKEQVILPQRVKLNKRLGLVNSSTNTVYSDFLQIKENNFSDFKTLTGIPRVITNGCHKKEETVAETLLLDKSTMTTGDIQVSDNQLDLNEISILFPEIPKQYVLDMIDRCQGDIDWAVDLLFDSEHNIFPEVNIDSFVSNDEQFMEAETKVGISYLDDKMSLKDKAKETTRPIYNCSELKKQLESTVVLNKSHYSDNVLKLIKKKNPEYLSLIENKDLCQASTSGDHSKEAQVLPPTEETVLEDDFLISFSNDGSNSNKVVFNEKTEEEDVELAISGDIILQLQQKFGNSSTPRIINSTPVVKLPVSLARQVYGYIMDSIQSEIDEQQEVIENMIANDEEMAKLLQYQDENQQPNLQEIMDFEVALSVHRADQEEWKEYTNDTIAAKLSKNILLEKFPQADPKVLMEMLHTHNYSLHDTVASLTIALDSQNDAKDAAVQDISADNAMSVRTPFSGVDPVSEAQSHRQQAATYYSLRMECLNKAHEAYRSGNKQVASYYSQQAQLHKGKIEECNSQAASCLLSTHKAGHTLDLHFLLVSEAEVVLDMFLDATVAFLHDNNKRYQTVFLITGRGLRSVGGVSRIKPMVKRKLQSRKILYNEVNPGMLSALIKADTPLSCVL